MMSPPDGEVALRDHPLGREPLGKSGPEADQRASGLLTASSALHELLPALRHYSVYSCQSRISWQRSPHRRMSGRRGRGKQRSAANTKAWQPAEGIGRDLFAAEAEAGQTPGWREAVAVHVGQCGNAIAESLWKSPLAGFAQQFERGSTSDPSLIPRVVQVDAEPKAVDASRAGAARLSSCRSAIGQGGRGGLAAQGLVDDRDGVPAKALECIRKEAERCSRAPAFVFVLGLCGGTGAGMGARLAQETADEFPDAIVTSAVAQPRQIGESAVAPLNACIALPRLLDACSGVLLLPNEPREGERASPQASRIASWLASSLGQGKASDKSALKHASPVEDVVESVTGISNSCRAPVVADGALVQRYRRNSALLAAQVRAPSRDAVKDLSGRLSQLASRPTSERLLLQQSATPVAIAADPERPRLLLAWAASGTESLVRAGAYVHWHERHGFTADDLTASAERALEWASELEAANTRHQHRARS